MIDTELVAAAIDAMSKAYAPYSQFHVGAAIRDEKGVVHVGANVENAAFPQGICAEASAISAMVIACGEKIKAIAIAGTREHLCTPCGGCRERIREFADEEAVIIIADEISERARFTLDVLPPHSLGPHNLV